MSSNQQQYSSSSSTSYSYTSTSYSSSSSSTSHGGQQPTTYTQSQQTRSSYNDRDGGTHERVTRETGRPTVVETTQIPAGGGRLESGAGTASGGMGSAQRRIEDVTDQPDRSEQAENDRRYLEAMEDEYAKREGGA